MGGFIYYWHYSIIYSPEAFICYNCLNFGFDWLYINPLLNFLDDSGLGGKIGNINVCAPTCTDDVALIAYNPLDIQTMVDSRFQQT
jgi:hypothetical protein